MEQTTLSRDECIEALRAIDSERPITRDRFRAETGLLDGIWAKHFGTFAEFKRQAHLAPTRHQAAIDRAIAKHASVDSLRKANEAKQGWEGRYLKPSGRRFETVVVISDLHDVECDPFYVAVLLDVLRRAQPEKLIIGGDLFDLAEFGKYTVDPRTWDVVGRIKWVHTFLSQVRSVCPDIELHLIEGNHELRILRHLTEATPALKAVLSDLHGFTIPKLLGLEEFEVNYVGRADLSAFRETDLKKELEKNYLILHECFLIYHYPSGKSMGMPGVNGHHHKYQVWPGYSPQFGSYSWSQIGCGHAKRAEYCNGEFWSLGFLLAHIDTERKRVATEYVAIEDDFAIAGGKWYTRGAVCN